MQAPDSEHPEPDPCTPRAGSGFLFRATARHHDGPM